MAPSAKHFSFLFFLALLSSQLSHARDSQFFSKVTPNPTTNNAPETVEVSNKEQTSLNKQEQQPSFIPYTQNGYGLYGHESGQLPPSTTTETPYIPYKTQSQEQAHKTNNNNNNYYYNKDAYVTQSNPQGMSEPRFTDRGYTTTAAPTTKNYNSNPYVTDPQGMSDTRVTTTNNNNNYYNGANNNYNNQQQQGLTGPRFMNRGYTTTTNPATAAAAATTNYYNGVQKQGMSDTRFLENGKYYYHVNKENNYPNAYVSSRGVDQYNNNKGYYGNYNENNSMEGYQNQEEFQESEEEYVP